MQNYKPPAHTTIANIERYSEIVDKMRAAGIAEEDIEFILDFQTKDALHVADLIEKSKTHEQEQKAKQLTRN